MRRLVTYEEALKRHPQRVAEALARLRKSKSKWRNAEPETLMWAYSWCKQVKGMSFPEMLASVKNPQPKKVLTEQQRVDEEIGAYILGLDIETPGAHYWSEKFSVVDMPPEIVDEVRARIQADMKEEARLATLTPEQRGAEVEGLLKQLRGKPGFFEVRIP
jgi:hypothetical protein